MIINLLWANFSTTIAGLGSETLAKAKVFQDAARKIGSTKIIESK